jgi:hypothetical protein
MQVCNHRFHGECLKRWGDTSCPVCRYCMFSSNTSTSRCSTCGTNANLWICLICGHVGCGRCVQADTWLVIALWQNRRASYTCRVSYLLDLPSSAGMWAAAGVTLCYCLAVAVLAPCIASPCVLLQCG